MSDPIPNSTLDPHSHSSTSLAHRGGREILLRHFMPGDEEAFRSLNEQWISKYFRLEEKDRETLSHPMDKILRRGGRILFAVVDGRPVGTCALIPIEQGVYEVAKMAVEETLRGSGIGRAVLDYTVAEAAKLGARRLYLETNSGLANAIHLYEAVGFRHLDPAHIKPSPYARADVYMEMLL